MSTSQNKDQQGASAFDKLNNATQCVDKERAFLNELMQTEPAGRVANRIVILMELFKRAESSIEAYLISSAEGLFKHNPREVAGIVSLILSDIVREARLCAYLCIKGVFPQAVTVLRRPIELVGILTHIWHDPNKIQYIKEADNNAYAEAFIRPRSKGLTDKLKAQGVKYRFMHCASARSLSDMYALLSNDFHSCHLF